jgi:hypothetical protein
MSSDDDNTVTLPAGAVVPMYHVKSNPMRIHCFDFDYKIRFDTLVGTHNTLFTIDDSGTGLYVDYLDTDFSMSRWTSTMILNDLKLRNYDNRGCWCLGIINDTFTADDYWVAIVTAVQLI